MEFGSQNKLDELSRLAGYGLRVACAGFIATCNTLHATSL